MVRFFRRFIWGLQWRRCGFHRHGERDLEMVFSTLMTYDRDAGRVENEVTGMILTNRYDRCYFSPHRREKPV